MAFPPSAYTQRAGVQTVSRAAAVESLFAPADADSPYDGAEEATAEAEVAAESQPVAHAA
jgi:hypothetical protein